MAARLTAWHARRRAVGEVGTSKAGEHPFSSAPHILYFTTEQCSTCRLLQEPALAQLDAPVRTVDAIAEGELARRFAIYTVPSTVVIGTDGTAANVKLRLCRDGKAPPAARSGGGSQLADTAGYAQLEC